MRKKALKKMNPNRHNIILSLRKNSNLKEILNSKGKTIFLNLNKRLLFNENYIDKEYNMELRRHAQYHYNKIIKEQEVANGVK